MWLVGLAVYAASGKRAAKTSDEVCGFHFEGAGRFNHLLNSNIAFAVASLIDCGSPGCSQSGRLDYCIEFGGEKSDQGQHHLQKEISVAPRLCYLVGFIRSGHFAWKDWSQRRSA
ncbi:MAG: hypothetical protein ACTHLK_07595 [Brucella intermedia]